MKKKSNMFRVICSLIAVSALFSAAPSRADDYYAGKTISLYAGRPPGGGVDAEMRLIAQFLGNFIPGHPRVVPLNMPGAGGVLLGNFLYNVAPKDGLTLGVPGRTSFLLSPMVGNPNSRYDLAQFTWIGSAASSNFMLWLRKDIGITTMAQLRKAQKPLVIGGSSGGNSDTVIPELLVKYEKLPLKVVRGYPGTSEEALAMQRGEIDGMFTEAASFSPDILASGLAVPVLQTFPLEPNLPTTDDIATNPREKALLDLFSVSLHIGLALVAPPGVDPHVADILRTAYIKMVTSQAYIDEARQRGFDVGRPNTGQAIADYLKANSNVAPDVKAEFMSYAQPSP